MTISFIAAQPSHSEDAFLTLQDFSWNGGIPWTPVIGEVAVNAFVSNKAVLETFGVDKETLSRRLSTPWTPEAALNDCEYHIRYQIGHWIHVWTSRSIIQL